METVLLCIAIIISIFTSILMGIDIGKKIATKDSEPISVPFFNPVQKFFIKSMVFTPKDKILKRLMNL